MKKIIRLLMVFLLVIGNIMPVSAKETDSVSSDENDVVGVFEKEISISDGEEKDYVALSSGGIGQVTACITRSGNTSSCQLYLKWSGSFAISGMRFNKLTIVPTNYLSSTVYGTMYKGSYYTYTFPNTTLYYQSISTFSIPTSVTKVRIQISNLHVYTDGAWLSGMLSNATVTIN